VHVNGESRIEEFRDGDYLVVSRAKVPAPGDPILIRLDSGIHAIEYADKLQLVKGVRVGVVIWHVRRP